MKISKVSLACLLALSTQATQVMAETEDGFEFHGYFRAGVLVSAENDFKRAKFPASKERLGRLGIESDSHFELALQKNFNMDNGQKIRIKTRAGADNSQSAMNQLGANADAANSQIGLMETFVEFEGVLSDTGVLWAGKRFYGKDNYIFMTDFFYTDMSGTGVGIEGVELGGNKWDFAYIGSDNSQDTANFWSDENNLMHAFHTSVNFGSFEVHGMAKHLPDNIVGGETYASSGAEVTGIYHSESVFGLSDKGFTKYIAQAGKGLGSGQLLGGTLTTYNAWKPGNGALEGPSKMKKVQSGDTSARALVWGGYFFENGVNVFHSIQGQYNDMEDGAIDYWTSAMVRPSFPVVENFFIATEFGYQYNNWKDASGSGDNATQYKATIAPTIIVPTGMGPAPEIRFLATYLDGDKRDKDFIVGIQADMWW